IVVGLAAEARLARRLGLPVAVGGGTAEGAARAAAALVAGGATGLISFGLAGGLDPALDAGVLLVPGNVLLDGVRLATDAALSGALGGADASCLFCAAVPIAGAAEKSRLFAATGCQAADLETGAVAAAARARGLPFAALRAVCDPARRTLPEAALVALDAGGGIGAGRIALSLLRHPGQIPALLALARDAARARGALARRVRLSRGDIGLYARHP
ncbi:MAG: hypothetical protein KGI51_03025, partial [Rhodospirillales bacterium]|nr:hypothetical protein [Rhodospirillales bacterium]